MRHLSIDLETYSENNIKLGIPKYVECPNFKILLFAYAWDFGAVHVVDLAHGEAVPANVIDALTDPEVTKHAFNAAFELHCLHRSGILTPYEQWACTQLHGLYLGYPKSLDNIGKALGLPQDKKKSASGKALIRYFCLPCKPTKRNGGRTHNLPEHDPEKWEVFKAYNAQDVVTEMEVCRRLAAFPVPDALHAEWVTDQKINRHGVLLDMELVRGALQIDAAEKQHLMQEAAAITGLANPNSRDQLLKWLNDNTNVELEKLTKESVAEALEVADDTAAKVLDIRRRLSKTSVKKYEMMNATAGEDDRVRGILQIYGANRTGRWAGQLIQGQNLPRNYIKNLDLARDLVRKGNREAVALLFGDVGDTLSQLIRKNALRLGLLGDRGACARMARQGNVGTGSIPARGGHLLQDRIQYVPCPRRKTRREQSPAAKGQDRSSRVWVSGMDARTHQHGCAQDGTHRGGVTRHRQSLARGEPAYCGLLAEGRERRALCDEHGASR